MPVAPLGGNRPTLLGSVQNVLLLIARHWQEIPDKVPRHKVCVCNSQCYLLDWSKSTSKLHISWMITWCPLHHVLPQWTHATWSPHLYRCLCQNARQSTWSSRNLDAAQQKAEHLVCLEFQWHMTRPNARQSSWSSSRDLDAGRAPGLPGISMTRPT
jgi:hypothetical protein